LIPDKLIINQNESTGELFLAVKNAPTHKSKAGLPTGLYPQSWWRQTDANPDLGLQLTALAHCLAAVLPLLANYHRTRGAVVILDWDGSCEISWCSDQMAVNSQFYPPTN